MAALFQAPARFGCKTTVKTRIGSIGGCRKSTTSSSVSAAGQGGQSDAIQAPAAGAAGQLLTGRTSSLDQFSQTIVIVRHCESTWNVQGRIQGNTDKSSLTYRGQVQSRRIKDALQAIHFDICLSSALERARETAKIIWDGRDEPIEFWPELNEAFLGDIQGMLNSDAEVEYAEEYAQWRTRPEEFRIGGRWPVKELYEKIDTLWDSVQARCYELAVSSKSKTKSKGEVKYVVPAVYGVGKPVIDSPPNGSSTLAAAAAAEASPAAPRDVRILIVTHKSITRSMLCRALGLGPDSFRLFDVNNGAMCVIKADAKGNKMITAVNLTAHMDVPQAGIQYQIL